MSTNLKVKKIRQTKSHPEQVTPQVEQQVPEVEQQVPEVDVEQQESTRSRLQTLVEELVQEKKTIDSRITSLKKTMKLYDQELRQLKPRKKTRRPRDPNAPPPANGIAKKQEVSDALSQFLHKHYQVPLGSLVSRTDAFSKTNGICQYINDNQLRKDGEIHPDSELRQLFGEPTDVSKKDGKTLVYYHKSLMGLLGKHFKKE